jgi:hypothetical protein
MTMPTSWLATIWSGITFALGIATKSAIDTYTQRHEAARKFSLDKKTAFLEQQLYQFYWPLYLLLEKDDLMYERITERDADPDSNASRLSICIESDFVLPNHQAVVKVIEENLHLARAHVVVAACVAYVRHVKVYEMLDAAGVKTDPINQGAPYPKNITDTVRQHCMKLQAEYDEMINQGAVPTAR